MTEKTGIFVEVYNYEEAMAQMRSIENAVKSFRGKKAKIELDSGEVITVEERIKELQQRLAALKSKKTHIQLFDGNNKTELRAVNKEIAKTRNELNLVQTASRRAGKTLSQTFNSMSSKIAHAGSAAQSLGNALSKIASPMRSLLRGTAFAAGYKLLDLATQGIQGATERADVFKTYEKSLSALGYDANKKFVIGAGEAMNALDNLEQSVLGLPTGLDEIVASQKKFLAASGDMEKATKAAIAANNIFLAQGSDQKDQLRGARQLRNLLAGGEMTGQRWQSILESMPMAINEVGKELKYANLDEFRRDLVDGKVDAQNFLDALLEVGTSGKIRSAVEEMKHTYGAATANIQNAFRRMGENVLKTLDEVLVKTTGKDTVDTLIGLKDVIDGFSKGVQDWIRANPDVITNFFETLHSFDWGSLARGIGDGLVWSLERALKVLRLFSKFDEGRIGRFLGKSGFLANFFTIGGGLLKGSRHILGGLGTTIAVLVKSFGSLASIKLGGGSLLGRLFKGGGVAPAKSFKESMSSLSGGLKLLGGIAIAGGSGAIAFGSVKSMLSNLKEIMALSNEIDWVKGAKTIGNMAIFFGAVGTIGRILGTSGGTAFGLATLKGTAIFGAFTTLTSLFADIDMALLKNSFKSFFDLTEYMNDGIENIKKIKEVDRTSLSDKVTTIVGTIMDVYDAIHAEGENGTKLSNVSKSEAKRLAKLMDNLSGIVSSVADVSGDLTELSVVDPKTAENASSVIESVITSLSSVFDEFPEGINPYAAQNTAESFKSFNDMFDSILGKDGLLAKAANVVDNSTYLPGMRDPLQALKEKLGGNNGIFTKLNEIVEDSRQKMPDASATSTLATKTENIANAFESIRIIFQKLNRIKNIVGGKNDKNGKIGGLTAVKSLINQLEGTFRSDRINALNSNIETFVNQLDNLLDSVEKINTDTGNINIEIHVKDTIYGREKVLRDIANLARDIRLAVDKIPTYFSKTVTVDINGHANLTKTGEGWRPGGALKNIPMTEAHGGYIYRAKGGAVGMKPRGTDTIPAMLTPGEYVQRRAAVKAFGKDFMQRVNALDVEGAIRSLHTRFGNQITSSRSSQITNIVNNNNNQKVTQNIHTNNPNFASKKISRFVGAF